MTSFLKRDECEFLEKNFLICLHEKSLKDNVPKRMCNVSNVSSKDNVVFARVSYFIQRLPDSKFSCEEILGEQADVRLLCGRGGRY